jgi:hypothetical protein
MNLELLIPAIKLADSSSIYRGYLSNSSLGKRVSRAVDIHLLFASKYMHECVTLGRLAKEYNLLHPNDALEPDEVETILNTSSHLFRDAVGWAGAPLDFRKRTSLISTPALLPLRSIRMATSRDTERREAMSPPKRTRWT